MHRFQQIIFAISLVALCWLLMMAIHELGHMVGAMATGGQIEKVVLHPLAISRTDVSPNPHPGIVVWLGPVIGCLLPLALAYSIPQRQTLLKNVAKLFAGFCLLANGAYISLGTFGQVGDCGQMLRTGTPHWVMFMFGAMTIPLGLLLWHRMGSLNDFLARPETVSLLAASSALVTLLLVILLQITLTAH